MCGRLVIEGLRCGKKSDIKNALRGFRKALQSVAYLSFHSLCSEMLTGLFVYIDMFAEADFKYDM